MRNDNGFWLKAETPQMLQCAPPVPHIKARPWASVFPLLFLWTATSSRLLLLAAFLRCSLFLLHLSLPPIPQPSPQTSTENLPWLQAAGSSGRHTEQQELWDHLQPVDGGGSYSGCEGGRRPAGHQHERQRWGGRLDTNTDQDLLS